MHLKVWILLAALLAVAYAAVEPLELELEAEKSQDPSAEHVRPKRFLIKKAIVAKKALVVGGAVGLVKSKLLSGAHGGGGHGGWSGGGGHGGWSGGGGHGGWFGGHGKPIVIPSFPVHHGGWNSGGGHGGWNQGGGHGGWSGGHGKPIVIPSFPVHHGGWNSGGGHGGWNQGGGHGGLSDGGGWQQPSYGWNNGQSGASSNDWASSGGGWSHANSNAWAGSSS